MTNDDCRIVGIASLRQRYFTIVRSTMSFNHEALDGRNPQFRYRRGIRK